MLPSLPPPSHSKTQTGFGAGSFSAWGLRAGVCVFKFHSQAPGRKGYVMSIVVGCPWSAGALLADTHPLCLSWWEGGPEPHGAGADCALACWRLGKPKQKCFLPPQSGGHTPPVPSAVSLVGRLTRSPSSGVYKVGFVFVCIWKNRFGSKRHPPSTP